MSPDLRKSIYVVLMGVGALVVLYGLATQDAVALWLALGDSVLSMIALLMAAAHVHQPPRRAYDEDTNIDYRA